MAAFFRTLLMLVLGVFVAGLVVALFIIGFVGLNVRRVWRWLRGNTAPHADTPVWRNPTATAVWQHYQTRYQHTTSSSRSTVVDVEDVDFRETPRTSGHTNEVRRLPLV